MAGLLVKVWLPDLTSDCAVLLSNSEMSCYWLLWWNREVTILLHTVKLGRRSLWGGILLQNLVSDSHHKLRGMCIGAYMQKFLTLIPNWLLVWEPLWNAYFSKELSFETMRGEICDYSLTRAWILSKYDLDRICSFLKL